MAETNFSDYEKELEKKGVIAFVPSGNSMWPTLKHRGQSVIVKLKTERLRPMDVALYRRANGRNVLHRVMEVTDKGYIMCGDSQFVKERVAEDRVYGVMIGFYRGKRYIEVTDPEYIERSKKLYEHESIRKLRVKAFFFFGWLKALPKRAWRKLFGKKDKEGSETND